MNRSRKLIVLSVLIPMMALVGVSLALAAAEDTGGPDTFGYTYIDSNEPGGPTFGWVEITGTNPVPFSDDTRHGPYPIGFAFDFYGTSYTDVWLGSNGWMSLGASDPGDSDSTNDCPLPSTAGNENLIAAIWDDLDPRMSGIGWRQSYTAGSCPYDGYSGACFVAEWSGMYHFASSPADDLTFEIILLDNNDIVIQIADAGNETGSGSTTGIENSTAIDGLTYGDCNTAGSIADALAILIPHPPPAARLEGSVKTGPSSVLIGDPITYTIVLSNSGDLAATGAVFTDPIPINTTYVPGSLTATSGITGFDGTNVTWTGDIAVGSAITISFAADTVGASCGAPLVNTAVATAPDARTPVTIQHSTDLWDNAFFATDFESDDGGFVANTAAGEWAWGDLMPSNDSPPAAHSGTRLWATNLSGDITAEPSDHYLTRTVSLPLFSAGELRWWDWWDEDGSDQGQVLIDGTQAYSIDTDQHSWQSHDVDLMFWEGQTVDMVFHYLAGGSLDGGAGWYMDDVTILTCDRPNLGIEVVKTVGTDPAACATQDAITVAEGTNVTYCYEVSNRGLTTLALHDLLDSDLGQLLDDFPATLGLTDSVFVTETATITGSTVNTATWTSFNAGPTDVVSDTDTATVVALPPAPFPTCVDFEGGTLPNFMYAETTSSGGANGRVAVTTAFPHTGLYAVDIDTDCDGCGGRTQQAAVMIVDLGGETNAILDFWVRGHGDENDPEDGVFISDDAGVTWAQILSLNGFPTHYQQEVIDLAAAAASVGMNLVDGFQIKFQSLDDFTTILDGYSFDDICVKRGLPAISLDKTVGEDASACASTDSVDVPAGAEVTYCYEVTNTGFVELTLHDLVDSELGRVQDDFAHSLTPGSSVFVTETVTIYTDTVNTSTWTAFNPGPADVSMASDSATVNVVAAPVIEVDPPLLEQTQLADKQRTFSLAINNLGNAALHWSLYEESGLAVQQAVPEVQQSGDRSVAREDVSRAESGEHLDAEVDDGRVTPWRPSGSVLYDNGPLVNSPGTGAGGADESMLQSSSLGMSALGFGHQASAGNRIADDFTISDPAGWQIDRITFFAYETGAPISGTMTAVTLRIWDGPPNGGGSVIWGDTTTNVMVSSGWSNIYRVTETTSGNTARAIMANVVDLGGLVLPPGTYWLDWDAGGSATYTGPWAPPVTINGQATTGNALQWTGSWGPANDGGNATRQGFPFIVEGSADICAPGDLSWLQVSPVNGMVPALGSQVLNVTFDSAGLTSGVHSGQLCIASNDPLERVWRIPVTLTVTELQGVYLPVLMKGAVSPLASPMSSTRSVSSVGLALLPTTVGLAIIPFRRLRRRLR